MTLLRERSRNSRKRRARLIREVLLRLRSRVPKKHRDRIIIFGSWVWGHPHEWSDIDVAVDDRGMSPGEGLRLLAQASVEGYEDFEDVLFLTEASKTLRQKILEKGISVDEALRVVERFMEGED